MRYLIEAAIETPADALAAEQAGADRLELSAALPLGGLTPTPGLARVVQSVCSLPVWVMIRPRGGSFVHDEQEFAIMEHDLHTLLPLAPAGFVFGALDERGQLAKDPLCRLVETAAGRPCVLHRAFDLCPDPLTALEEAIAIGFTRVLTSGGAETATGGAEMLRKLIDQARGRIEILPCGKIRSENVVDVVQTTGCSQVHAAFRAPGEERLNAEDLARTRINLDRLAASKVAQPSPMASG